MIMIINKAQQNEKATKNSKPIQHLPLKNSNILSHSQNSFSKLSAVPEAHSQGQTSLNYTLLVEWGVCGQFYRRKV